METAVGRRWGRWVVVSLIGLVALAGLGLYGLRVGLAGLVFSRVRAAAHERGVELDRCDGFDFTRDGFAITHVSLRGCEFTSNLPMAPSGSFEQLDADLANEVPVRVSLLGADVKLTGELKLLELYAELGKSEETAFVTQRNRISWFTSPDAPAAFQINNLARAAATDPWSGELMVGQDLKGQFAFGKELSVTLEHNANPKNVMRLRADPARFFGTLNVELEGLPMTVLSGVVFHKVPPELLTVQLSGHAQFDLPFALNPKQPKGHFKFSFEGLNFPVPREVAGLVYDTSPEIEGDVAINRTFTKMKVDKLSFVTGSLRMKGNANVERTGVDTRWRATLRGPLPCDAIAAAAAKIHLQGLPLGHELAQAAARISKQSIKGSVEILVALDAESKDLTAAKIAKTIGVGCGLKPLPLAGIALDLIKDLPLGVGVGEVLHELPTLPELPALPEFPKLPGLGQKKHATESQTTSAHDD